MLLHTTIRMSEAFFSQKNETMLHRVLYNDVCRRTGGDLNEKQAGRLMKTVKHYMTEVHRVQGNKPVNTLNSEVLTVVLSDYMMYIERSGRSDRSVMSDMDAGDGKEDEQLPAERPRIQDDVGSAFSKMQASRQEVKSRPPIQDFRLTLQDEGTVSMDVFDRIKKDREAEAERVNAQQLQLMQQERPQDRPQQRQQQQNQQTFADATDMFSRGNKRAAEESEAAFAARERANLEARASAAARSDATYKPQVPDIRSLVLGDTQNLDRRRPVYELSLIHI